MNLKRVAALGFAIILGLNAFVLTKAWYNQGQIIQSVALSKNELAVYSRTDSRMTLHFNYPAPNQELPQAWLQSLQIDCRDTCTFDGWAAFELDESVQPAPLKKQQADKAQTSRLTVTAIALSQAALNPLNTHASLVMPVSVRYYSATNAHLRLKHASLYASIAQRQQFLTCPAPQVTVTWGRLGTPWIQQINCPEADKGPHAQR